MRLVTARGKALMLEDDGRINAPLSFYLNLNRNPNTLSSNATSLKLLHRFLLHSKVQLADRALEGRCLEEREIINLVHLAYRPLKDLDQARRIARHIDVLNAEIDKERKGAVDQKTASKRLILIADFLVEYEKVIAGYIKSLDTRARLAAAYQNTCQRLRKESGGADNDSDYDIRSMTPEDFLECLGVVYMEPYRIEKVLRETGESELLASRDRAMFMLSCEGLRPGELLNLRVNDLIRGPSGLMSVQIVVNRRHRRKVSSSTPMPKGASSTQQSYAKSRLIHIWPFTRDAVEDYLNGSRAEAISKSGADTSSGFLFLTSNGKQLASRQATSLRFCQMCDSLSKAGYMKVIVGPGRNGAGESGDLSAYTMRHSAVNYFYVCKVAEGLDQERIFDLMRARFGWTATSDMPARYARRAITDQAMVYVTEIYDRMRAEVERLAPRRA